MTPREYKPSVCPEVFITHNGKDTGLNVEIDLPGVGKKGIELSVGNEGFCVCAERDDEMFQGCYQFAHSVDKNKARARFDNGMLRLDVPFRGMSRSRKIPIE